jgi:hypothetical protein
MSKRYISKKKFDKLVAMYDKIYHNKMKKAKKKHK